MKKSITLVILAICLSLSNQSFAAIYGAFLQFCSTSNTYLCTDTFSVTGIWSSSNTAVATIGSPAGSCTTVFGVSGGTATISYSSSFGVSTVVVTVDAQPSTITLSSSPVCTGASVTLSTIPSGGTWISHNTAIATIDLTTGILNGIGAGAVNIVYQNGTCYTYSTVTVNPSSVDTLHGVSTICVGSTTSLTSMVSSGTWVSSHPAIATVSAGVVTGVAAGTTIITHTSVTSCGTVTGTKVITVLTPSSTVTVSGPTTMPVGGSLDLTASTPGGSWISSTPSIAYFNYLAPYSDYTGNILGVGVGTTLITYSLSGCGGVPVQATYAIAVVASDCISGNILFSGSPYYGPLKVWLIKYNPSTTMLTASDSLSFSVYGTSASYSFCGMTTDSFRVKAAVDSVSGTIGYLPTYHNSSPFWNSATVVYHTAGTNDINKNITMGSGTPTTGPGFVGGLVTSGANKGTADELPVPNLLVFAINNATGSILQSTYTDATGRYTFSSLPTGTPIKIYPELINYITTPYPAITLTASTPSMTTAHFSQNTLSETITPIVSSVSPINATNTKIGIFPNPAHGTLNVAWSNITSGIGIVTLADITGRNVLEANINMDQTSGSTHINLSDISAGLYLFSIKANGINYNTKVVVE